MQLSEFALIDRYFASQVEARADVVLGIGDDCALLRVPVGQVLAVTVDMLVAGVHFPADADPEGIGYKSLAVNLSDLAAMGAMPAWVTLAIALPKPDASWLRGFCRGFFQLAERFQVQLVGGDTTRGAMTISIQAHGFIPEERALRRDGARPGDIVYVTGTLGDAGLALAAALGRVIIPDMPGAYLQMRLERPSPRVQQGLQLRGLASAAIDISDGLAQDLGHILERSGVGARVDVDRLPYSPAFKACQLDTSTAIAVALSSGDDYELCFTVPPVHMAQILILTQAWDCDCTVIGVIEPQSGLRCQYQDGRPYPLEKPGYEHFA